MGAFGQTLQRHFGGTKHDVRTWDSNNKPKTKPTKKELEEEDANTLVMIEQNSESIMQKGEELLKLLNDSKVFTLMKTEKGCNKLQQFIIKFKTKYGIK